MKKIVWIFAAALALAACTKTDPASPAGSGNNDQKEQTEEPDEPKPDDPKPTEGAQLYNMSFDLWSEDKNHYPLPYAADATEAEQAVWASANSTTAGLGFPTLAKEDSFVAVKGEGKHAVKVQTQGVDFFIVKKLAAGSIFTGRVGDIDISKMSASIFWGVPFTDRPAKLEGYYCYQPKTIDWVQAPYTNLKGQTDTGHIMVILSDWDSQFEVSPPDKLLDVDNNPGIIGYAKIEFKESMSAYQPFSLEIKYRNDRTPKQVTVVCASSALGDYFTGAAGSVLYVDELKFVY